MKYLDLQTKISTNIFTFPDVLKAFHSEDEQSIKVQLSRFTQKGHIVSLRKGIYVFDQKLIDPFVLANILHPKSYISLETALNYYGIIPDVPQSITSVTTGTTKYIDNTMGNFSYAKIKTELYFGFSTIKSNSSQSHYRIAEKEKAILDYIYIRKINNVKELRLDLSHMNKNIFSKYLNYFPKWIHESNIFKL